MSDLVASIRSRIKNGLLPPLDVGAVILEDDRFLRAHPCGDSGPWSLLGGGVEPGEKSAPTPAREVCEGVGVKIHARDIVATLLGRPMAAIRLNGHQLGCVTVRHDCGLPPETPRPGLVFGGGEVSAGAHHDYFATSPRMSREQRCSVFATRRREWGLQRNKRR